MKTIEYIGYHDKNCERMAARHHLTFHCDGCFITEYDDDRKTREATDPEQAMWIALVGDFDPECLPATSREIQDTLQYRKGPFTLNATDVAAMRKLKGFKTCLNRQDLLDGLIGWLVRPPCDYQEDSPWFRPVLAGIYVSRSIQVGYVYEGERVPEMHWRPGPVRVVEPEIPIEIECKVGLGLQPLMTDWC